MFGRWRENLDATIELESKGRYCDSVMYSLDLCISYRYAVLIPSNINPELLYSLANSSAIVIMFQCMFSTWAFDKQSCI